MKAVPGLVWFNTDGSPPVSRVSIASSLRFSFHCPSVLRGCGHKMLKASPHLCSTKLLTSCDVTCAGQPICIFAPSDSSIASRSFRLEDSIPKREARQCHFLQSVLTLLCLLSLLGVTERGGGMEAGCGWPF